MAESMSHSSSLLQPSASPASSHVDTLSALGGGGGESGPGRHVGGARDTTIGLTHVLSGFQEEGNLVQALQEHQTHGEDIMHKVCSL